MTADSNLGTNSNLETDSDLEKEMTSSPGLLADRLDRFLAFIIDQLALILILSPFALILLLSNLIDEKQLEAVNESTFKEVIPFILFLLVNNYMIRHRSQTIGKAVMGLMIVDDQFRPASTSSITLRYGFFYAISMIPFIGAWISLLNILFIFRKDRMCLHDYFAATKVVYAKKMVKTRNSPGFSQSRAAALKNLSNPVYIEDYCQRQDLSLDEVKGRIERGELDAYEDSDFLFVDDKS